MIFGIGEVSLVYQYHFKICLVNNYKLTYWIGQAWIWSYRWILKVIFFWIVFHSLCYNIPFWLFSLDIFVFLLHACFVILAETGFLELTLLLNSVSFLSHSSKKKNRLCLHIYSFISKSSWLCLNWLEFYEEMKVLRPCLEWLFEKPKALLKQAMD